MDRKLCVKNELKCSYKVLIMTITQPTNGRDCHDCITAHSCTVDSSDSHTVLNVVGDSDLCRIGVHSDW